MPVRFTVIGNRPAPEKIEAARRMRLEPTAAEKALWRSLRTNRLDGWHFRRQQVIAGYIVDFYCHAAALIIEIDGDVHLSQVEYDQERDAALIALGFRVLRFTNQEVLEKHEEVLEAIRKNLTPTEPGT